MAKQITLKKIIELGGFIDNNHLAHALINNLDNKIKYAEVNGYKATAKVYRERWNALFDELDKLGYWDE